MTENTIEGKGHSKKVRGAVAGVGLLGVAALAIGGTTANWTDSESVGADFTSGEYNLQVAVEQTPEGEWTWVDSENDDYASIEAGADLGFFDGAWGPAQVEERDFAVRLAPETTHDAVVDVTLEQDAGFSDNFALNGITEEAARTFAPGEVQEYTAQVESDAGNSFEQGLEDVGFTVTFDSESAELSEDDGGEDEG